MASAAHVRGNAWAILKRLLPLVYFLAVSLPHHPFSSFFDKNILIPAGFFSVQHATDLISLAILVGVALMGVRVVRVHRSIALRHFVVWAIFLALMYVGDRYLIVNNIERIHFPQYAVLAMLLKLSLQSDFLVFSVASVAGFVDEFLQYVMNPNRTNYLDFNDIVLNILGAALGVLLLLGIKKNKSAGDSSYESKFRRVFYVTVSASLFAVVSAFALGRIEMLVERSDHRNVFDLVNGKYSFIMSFERHDEFWVNSYFGKVFHVFSPFEGLLIASLLSVFTWRSVRWLKAVGEREADSSPPQADQNDV